jgi:hypothetical protein
VLITCLTNSSTSWFSAGPPNLRRFSLPKAALSPFSWDHVIVAPPRPLPLPRPRPRPRWLYWFLRSISSSLGCRLAW